MDIAQQLSAGKMPIIRELKRMPYWGPPFRRNSRFDKIVADQAPKE